MNSPHHKQYERLWDTRHFGLYFYEQIIEDYKFVVYEVVAVYEEGDGIDSEADVEMVIWYVIDVEIDGE